MKEQVVVTVHGEGYGLGEFELGPSAQREEFLAIQIELHCHC